MTVTGHPLTRAYLRDRLRELARVWDQRDLAARQILLAGWTDPHLPPPAVSPCHCGKCLLCVWAEYRHDLEMRDALREGDGVWQEVNPDLAGAADPHGEALTQADTQVAWLEDLLIGRTS